MTTAIKGLSTLKAGDIMQRAVFKLDPNGSIEDAVRTLSEMHISGAPVVDGNERLVGVLSAFDIARPENMREGALSSGNRDYPLGEISPDDDGSYDEDVAFSMDDYSPEALRSGRVADFMNPDVMSVVPDASIKSVCALMVKEHIHRVLVVKDGKLAGIISSLDIARCVAERT